MIKNLRKTILIGLATFTFQGYAQEKGIINTSNSPNVKLKSINMGECKWTEGFWAEKFKIAEEVMVPYMGTLLKGDTGHGLNNFKIAAGLKEGVHKGFAWHDGDFYKWMEAMSYVYSQNKDPKILKELDEIIEIIAKAQMEDGYLQTQIQLNDKADRFENRRYHEMYNSGHLYTSACIHHRVTGQTNFLDIATKHADQLYSVFMPENKMYARFGFNQTQILGLVELYRTTKNEKYLKLAEKFINNRGKYGVAEVASTKGYPVGDMVQERTPLRESSEAVGHAVLALYYYAGAADVAAETGEQALIDALDRLWDNVTNKKMYVTGALGQSHYGASSNRDPIQEGFIDEYMMPNLTAYNETCANICNSIFNHRMLSLKGESKHADIMELVLYNSALSGISLEGTKYYYANPLRKIEGALHYEKMNTEFPERQPYLECFCCPPNLVRTIAGSSNWAYSLSANGLTVNLFGGNQLKTHLLDGSVLELEQKTNYPWNGNVKLNVMDCKKEAFDILVRIPGWAVNSKVYVNGKEIKDGVIPGQYLKINREWKKGDKIELEMPMNPTLIEGNTRIEELTNQVAVKRGPVVYCLESTDLPKDTKISSVYLKSDRKITVKHDKDLLGGITYLETTVDIREDQKSGMYNPVLTTPEFKTQKTKLIPYYTWSNRGNSEMTVFLPVKW